MIFYKPPIENKSIARLVEGVVTQPASLRPRLQVRVAIGGHHVPGLQELDWPVLLVAGKPVIITCFSEDL